MKKVLQAPPDTPIRKAAKLMALRKVGAIMVVERERLVGIFTERDMVFRVVARGLDVDATSLADVMTPEPITVDPEKPFGYALVVMQENGFRHLPVIEDGKPVGMISSRNAMDPDLEEFVSETRRREHWKKAARHAS
ncbi:MAG: CBS domain-containing protein [Usitatibacter sp.]